MGGSGGLLKAQEAREAKRRVEDNHRNGLLNNLSEDNTIFGQIKYLDRTENTKREKDARSRAAEERQLEGLYQAQKDRQLKQQWAQEEALIANALESKRKEQEKMERLVQKVSEESEELQELKAKLKAAEVNFERQLQKDEKAMIKERDQQYTAAFDSLMEDERQKNVMLEEESKLAKRQAQVMSRKVLEDQMAEKVQLQLDAKIEFAKERAHVDQIVERIKAEDQAEAERKHQKVQETKMWVNNFMAMREDLREQERQRLRDEEQAILEYAQEIERRQNEAAQMAADKQEEADRIHARLAAEKEEAMRRQEEMEMLINRLHFEEQEEKYRIQAEEKRVKQENMRVEMMQANEYQRQLKAQRKEQEIVEEEEFRRRMLEKFAEDDRIEQLNAQRRRMKMQEHKREVERLAQVKYAMYQEQMSREMEEQRGRIDEEEAKAHIVEQERQRLLREHAARLKDYLPKGVLAVPEDLVLIETIAATMRSQQPQSQ